jgi:hypothetical protein
MPVLWPASATMHISRLGGEVTFTRSRKRVENWSSNFNAISLALGAVSFKRENVLGGGQVPVPMFARVSQSASECCPERGRMPSLASVGSHPNLKEVFLAIDANKFMNLGPDS